jgi:hypothetical protein
MDHSAGLPTAASFGIRLWPEAGADGAVEWRGRVRHLASQETIYFRDFETLVAFLRATIERPDPSSPL